jgi:hypothetical protein
MKLLKNLVLILKIKTTLNTASCAARGRERPAVLGLRHTAHEKMKVRGVAYAGNVICNYFSKKEQY